MKAPLPDRETQRLRLRRFQPDDTDAIASVFAKPEVWTYPFGRGLTWDETATFVAAQVEEWDRCGFGLWLAVEKHSGRTAGLVGLSVPRFLPDILPAVEVGWRLDPDVWGKGYATEGATAALDEAFGTLGLAQVCSAPQTENPASGRVCERLGMSCERIVRLAPTERRGAVDVDLYWIDKEEWEASAPHRVDRARVSGMGLG